MSCSFAYSSRANTSAERELYRYYQPVEFFTTPVKGAPKASHDTTLTALSQLGALRLNAKRGLITLATQDAEYIIAEAGQTLSLQDESRHKEDDGLWHGVGKLRPDVKVAKRFYSYLSASKEEYVVIPDVDKDAAFSDVIPKNAEHYARFLAASPIKTPSDVTIGFYVVADVVPHPEGLTEDEAQFLKDMATTVMDHLESIRQKKKAARAERMVKALGLFVEGEPSLRNWWIGAEKDRRNAIKSSTKKNFFESIDGAADYLFGTPENPIDLSGLRNHRASMFATNSEDSPGSSVTHDPFSERMSSISSDAAPVLERPKLNDQDRNTSYTTSYTTSATTPATTVSAEELQFDSRRRMSLYPPDELPMSPQDELDDGKSLQSAVLSTKVKDAFARAANLVREAIHLDGAIFFDATVSSFGASAKEKGDEKAPGGFSMNSAVVEGATSGSEEELRRVTTNGQLVEESTIEPTIHEATGHLPEKGCNILGYSTRKRSTIYGHAAAEEFQQLPEKFLRSLLKKYPHGKAYNFGEDGTMCTSESDGGINGSSRSETRRESTDGNGARKKRKTMSKETEARVITRAFPGARSVIFYPLWDSGRERWFSGSFIWTTSPCRVLCPSEDLTYIASFSNSIMAEVNRLAAQLSSQMKTDFVSSISHELRSPLHGILASVELLQESDMSTMQADLITTINSCGKTLLDTINHVLDFSKVNRKRKDKRLKSRPKKSNSKHTAAKSDEFVPEDDAEDLSILTEEVIESVYAGSAVGMRLCRSEPGHKRALSIGGPSISVIVDVEWRPWTYRIDGGAFRRILMNIFGNSMKYTNEGFVRVVLRSEDDALSKDGKAVSSISLTITDTGKGISQEFLKTHLYTPFAQEDALSAGTGLGLSIVQQIVHDLGGSINFQSEQGAGTEAKIILPLTSSALPELTPDDEKSSATFTEVRSRTKSMKACLVAFDVFPDITEEPTGILSSASQSKISLKSAVGNMMRDWFGTQLSSTSKLEIEAADVHVISEESLTEHNKLWDDIEEYRKRSRVPGVEKIIMILCVTYPVESIVIDEEGLRVFYVQQPYGPHKIAAALHRALYDAPSNVKHEKLTTAMPENAPQFPPLEYQLSPPETKAESEAMAPSSAPMREDLTGPSDVQEVKVEEVNNTSELRVLLVEDNEINLKLLVTYMRKLKLPHSTAVNGLEALNLFRSTSGAFDCILMDISMPVMDGLTSARKIRQHENENSMPPPAIIALTGAASMSARQEAFSAGIDLFLTKPVPLKKLKGLLEDLKRDGRDSLIEAR